MNAAVLQTNPLNRFKFTCTALLSSPYYLDMFLKPVIYINMTVEPNPRINFTGWTERWNKSLLWTNFTSPSSELFLDLWSQWWISIFWILWFLNKPRSQFPKAEEYWKKHKRLKTLKDEEAQVSWFLPVLQQSIFELKKWMWLFVRCAMLS